MTKINILQLVGSAQDEFYCDLSRLYAQDCLKVLTQFEQYHFLIAYITPDRQWRFPQSLSQEDIFLAQPMSLTDAIANLTSGKFGKIDLVLPQMFCLEGMTQYRGLLELLKLPYIGNSSEVMSITANKAKAKAIVSAAGVKVPKGELLYCHQTPTIAPPAVVKPANSDNSLGVSLVQNWADYPAALNAAFTHSHQVLVEEFIPLGREVRCGIVVKNGELMGLPLEEYQVHPTEHPIRNYEDKLKRVEGGDLTLVAKDQTKAWMVDPSDPLTAKVQAVAKQCHLALGCRHYSLFDFRIDPQGNPYFLEAGLYCSFAPKSVIVTMARAANLPLNELLEMMIESVVELKRDRSPLIALPR